MQTQAKAELDVRDAGGAGATPAPAQVQLCYMGEVTCCATRTVLLIHWQSYCLPQPYASSA